MKTLFIINPKSGKGKIQKKIIEELKKRNLDFHITQHGGDATKIAKEFASAGEDVRIYSCGGEGTNFEVINGLIGCDNVSMGFIPGGSANDFLKYFKSDAAFLNIDEQLNGEEYMLDLIKITLDDQKVYYSVNSCSAGMDAMVCENANLFKKNPFLSGNAAYAVSVAYTAFKKFSDKIRFFIDGEELKNIKCLFAVCANAPVYGGGYTPAPNANPADGMLDYSIISTSSKLKVISILGKYRKGVHTDLPYCYHGNCQTMEYVSETPVPFNIDGEIYRIKHAFCEIEKKALKVILPKSVAEKYKTELTVCK